MGNLMSESEIDPRISADKIKGSSCSGPARDMATILVWAKEGPGRRLDTVGANTSAHNAPFFEENYLTRLKTTKKASCDGRSQPGAGCIKSA